MTYNPAAGGADTAAQILAKLITVDGATSGLDADLLDGNSSAYFASAADLTAHAAAADPHAGYVLESLIDAAADLIVGTADNTVGRLAKGTALQVLRVDSAANALEWATSKVPTTGRGKSSTAVIVHSIPGFSPAFVATSTAFASGVRRYSTFVVDDCPKTIDSATFEVVTAVAATTGRWAIFAADEDRQPTGASLYDSGDVSTATTGVKTQTPAITLPVGVYSSIMEINGAVQLRALRGTLTGGTDLNPAWSTNPWSIIGTRSIAYGSAITNDPWTAASFGSSLPEHYVSFRISDPSA